jgi:16S rRNA (adenine1518-N6/adenine1519-N6)-dimethyltransferase
LRPKKRLGQHFLMDGGAAARSAALAVDEPGRRVIEIGAGTGALTHALLEREARVRALEIDPDLVELLRSREDLSAAEIVAGDALTFDYDAANGGERWHAAGNLPYNIATPLILRWSELENPPQRVVAMVQRDVADRFTASAGTPAYGSLTLAVRLAFDVRRAFKLGPQVFYPRPKVESAVVVMERHVAPPVSVRDLAFLRQVVRGAFAYRRKTLANSLGLALGLERERVHAALERLHIDTEIRGEQLDLDAFAALADELGA